MTRVVVTGGCGFIGHHLVEHLHQNTDWDIIILDSLSYSSFGFSRLKCAGVYTSPRVTAITIDLSAGEIKDGIVHEIGDISHIFHLAAETHVDNSIIEPKKCITNNIESTVNVLEFARHHCPNLETFLYFSTDEVYGSALDGKMYNELDRHEPSNPYSASKSASEKICESYKFTYNIPLKVVNVMNVFGERQHVEKFIPKCIKTVLENKHINIHCYKNLKPGSRFYIHARNVAAAVLHVIEHGKIGNIYHITGEMEVDNLEMAQFIADTVKKPLNHTLVDGTEDRPGHDLRYGLDGTKLFDIGFVLPVDFWDSVRKTVLWTTNNQQWLEEWNTNE
jgi:dTDP-glucose 4,6-dehydratase